MSSYASLPAFPDAEDIVLDLLNPIAPSYTETDEDTPMPCIRVNRVGGGTSSMLEDRPRVEVHCIADDRPTAWDMMAQVEQRATAARGTTVRGTLIDRVWVDNPPMQPPNDNPNVRRVLTFLRFAWRRPFTGDE